MLYLTFNFSILHDNRHIIQQNMFAGSVDLHTVEALLISPRGHCLILCASEGDLLGREGAYS